MRKAGSGFVRRVTRQNLDEFRPLLHTREEPLEESLTREDYQRTGTSVRVDPELLRAEALFEGVPIQVKIFLPGPVEISPSTLGIARGPLLWQKVLSRTDAQRQIGNITGDLRLTQAGFRVDGRLIDQTTYFRQTVFAAGGWIDQGTVPRVETARFNFAVTIYGRYYGVHRLTVSHKPSGEAGQGNYTTGLRWGELTTFLANEQDTTGATLYLWGPPAGATEPFFLEIT